VNLEQFFPTSLSIKVGQTVIWKNDTYEPHMVVLRRRMSSEDPLVFGSPIPPPGTDYAGGVAISGLFAGGHPADRYSLTFTRPGSYTYMCPVLSGNGGGRRGEVSVQWRRAAWPGESPEGVMAAHPATPQDPVRHVDTCTTPDR
jgi:plastocyanin